MAALLRVLPRALLLFPVIFCEQVPPPMNLSVQALNTNYMVHWDWVGMDNRTVTFTVQSIGKFRLRPNHSNRAIQKNWRMACEETSNRFCDLNPLNLHYLGVFTLRVRATVNGNQSEWAHVDFAPSKEAAVGPPTRVLVSHAGNDLKVSISEPQTSTNISMKDKIYSLYYRFLYWEQHTNHKAHVDSPNAVVVLQDLKSWTWYCVSVQSRTIEPNRNSTFTDPVCISTQGGFQWAKFTWIFVTSLLLVLISVLAILLGCYSKKHFKTHVARPAFLEEQDWRFPPVLLCSEAQSEQYDRLTIVTPSSQEHDHSRARPEWQSGNDSQDSGIHFPSEQSASEQSASEQSTSEQSTSEQSAEQNQERLGAQDARRTPKDVQLFPDEGFEEHTPEEPGNIKL